MKKNPIYNGILLSTKSNGTPNSAKVYPIIKIAPTNAFEAPIIRPYLESTMDVHFPESNSQKRGTHHC